MSGKAKNPRPRSWLGARTAMVPCALESAAELVLASLMVLLPERLYFRLYRLEACEVPQDPRDGRRDAPLVCRMVERLANTGLPPARCLPRALAAHRMLRRRGLDPVTVFGVTASGDAMKAHAWVVLGSCIVLDSEAASRPYTALAAFR